MDKILNEYNGNKYAKLLHEVEAFLEEKDVSISFYGLGFIQIEDRLFRFGKNTSYFPRTVSDQELFIEERRRI